MPSTDAIWAMPFDSPSRSRRAARASRRVGGTVAIAFGPSSPAVRNTSSRKSGTPSARSATLARSEVARPSGASSATSSVTSPRPSRPTTIDEWWPADVSGDSYSGRGGLDHEHRRGRDCLHHEIEELEGRRVEPVQVFRQHDQGAVASHGEEPLHHRALQVLTLLTGRAELDRVAARVGSEPEHRCQQRRDLRGIEARHHEPGIEVVEAGRRRVVGLPTERLRGHLRERGEGGVLSVRRAPAFEPDVILAGQPVPELVDEARLADPGLATDVHDLPAAVTCARPAGVEHRELVPTADEPRPATMRQLRGRDPPWNR